MKLYKEVVSRNIGYFTVSIPVPIEVLKSSIIDSMIIGWE